MPVSSDRTPRDAVVCVPACNEAERIGRLLDSLAAQTAASTTRPLKVVVLNNNSTDKTGDIVRAFHREPRLDVRLIEVALPADQAHAGTARRLAMDAGARWLEASGVRDGMVLSTDADAVAPDNWVSANLEALASADLVGGRLVIGNDRVVSAALADLNARVDRYWSAVRALEDRLDPPSYDPSPRHGDHTGASLALRADLYRAVGGVPPVASGEDNALVAAVIRHGGRVRHCPKVWIEVSAREIGRAAGGMAHEMARRRDTVAKAEPYRLPSAAFWHAHLLRRAAWRAQWPKDGATFCNAIAYVADREARARPPIATTTPIEIAIADIEAMAAPPIAAA